MQKRKHRTNFYINAYKKLYIANIITSDSTMITVLTVPKKSQYVPPHKSLSNVNYMPEMELINTVHKAGFSYYIYDITFRLLNKDDEVTDEIVKYLNDNLFDLTINY